MYRLGVLIHQILMRIIEYQGYTVLKSSSNRPQSRLQRQYFRIDPYLLKEGHTERVYRPITVCRSQEIYSKGYPDGLIEVS